MLTKEDCVKIVEIFSDRKINHLSNERMLGRAEMKTVLLNDFAKWLKEDNPDFDDCQFIEDVKIF